MFCLALSLSLPSKMCAHTKTAQRTEGGFLGICGDLLGLVGICGDAQVAGREVDRSQVEGILKQLQAVQRNSAERREERAKRTESEDFDEEESEALEEENDLEDEILDGVGAVHGVWRGLCGALTVCGTDCVGHT